MNLRDAVDQAQSATHDTSKPTNTTPLESILGGRATSRSYHLTLSATMVLLAKVKKLEAQISSLVHHI